MTSNDFKTATLQDFKDACSDKDADSSLNILVEDFADNMGRQRPYNFSPAIVQTLGNLARDDANNEFLKELLVMIDAEFTDIDDLHLAIRDGANELLNNEDMTSFIDKALSNMTVDSSISNIVANADDEYYLGDGDDLVGIDDDPDGSSSDLNFNI